MDKCLEDPSPLPLTRSDKIELGMLVSQNLNSAPDKVRRNRAWDAASQNLNSQGFAVNIFLAITLPILLRMYRKKPCEFWTLSLHL